MPRRAHRLSPARSAFPESPTARSLESRADELTALVRRCQDHDREAASLDQLRQAGARLRDRAREAEDLAARKRREGENGRAAWTTWKSIRSCPEALQPETAQQFFAAVERIRDNLTALDTIDAEIATLGEEIDALTVRIQEAFRAADLSPSPETTLPEDAIALLQERLEGDEELRSQRETLTQQLESTRSSFARAEQELGAATDTVKSVLAEAGASDEPTCRARIGVARRRAELKRSLMDAERRLRSRLGTDAHAEEIRTALRSGDRQGWEARKQECKAALAALQPAHDQAVRYHQSELDALEALERECDVVALATEREAILAEIREAVSEWRRVGIAQALVQATLRRYEVERQPAVLVRAAAAFSRVTAGRYVRLAAREGGLDVIASSGGRLDTAALSRGAAEELYLCLRVALASEFARLSVSLPIIMDDVLVNFDPMRAARAGEVLVEAARDQQVLLLTCHPETVALLTGLAPTTRIVEIPPQGPTAGTAEAVGNLGSSD